MTHETRTVAGEYPSYGPVTTDSVRRAAPLTNATVGEILEHGIGIPPAYWTQKDQNRVSACLKKIGWVRLQRRNGDLGGKREWRYWKPGTEPE